MEIHADCDHHPTYVCWIPNISASVTSYDNISSIVNGSSVMIAEDDYEFVFANGIIELRDACNVAWACITPIDDGGMCKIIDYKMSENKNTYDINSDFFIREVWAALRSIMDGCSELCPCNAMDRPIYLQMNQVNIYDLIASRFIESLENIADSEVYAQGVDINDPTSVARRRLTDEIHNSSNIIYFERYLDIYEDRIGRSRSEYSSQIHSRKEKGSLIRHYNTENHRINSTDRMSALMDSISGYSREICNLTEYTNIQAGKSDRKSLISIWIAAFTAGLSFVALIYTTLL